ncbi:MAG: RAMP superfamily CRISPR-associated protein [Candidatus Heimdallarchaeota archaeon]
MRVSRTFKRITVRMRTPIAKTGNGTIGGGKINNLLSLGKEGRAGKEGTMYLVKGLRGLLGHAMMALAKEQGREICHSSDKSETQKGEQIIPEGFHPTGACYPKNECIKHKIMGSIHRPSRIKFEPVIIVSSQAKQKPIGNVNVVHIATEKRNALAFGTKKAIQDFGERYFSGEFSLKIELLEELAPEVLKFLLQALLYMPELGLGASVNNGAGKIELLEIAFEEVQRTRAVTMQGEIREEEKTRSLWKELEAILS